MIRKTLALLLVLSVFCALLFGCESDNLNVSSVFTGSEQTSTDFESDFGEEYPSYNEGYVFSDVSVPLVSDNLSSDTESVTPSSSSSSKPSSSSKNPSAISNSSKPIPNTSSNQTTTQSMSTSSNTAVINKDTMKAVWISYIDFASILTNKSESAFRSSFETVCKNASNFGLNTLVCQIRASADATYPSKYFVWADYVAGIGKNPGYDPLKIMVELAHKYNLSFHAWINPFRAHWDSLVPKIPSDTTFKKWYNDSSKKGKYIVQYKEANGNYKWYFNPGEPEVRELIVNGILEIIKNYSVDGIHFDDYFYPRGIDKSFDSDAYSKYGKGKTLSEFRTSSVNTLVKDVYNAIKKYNSKIVFGISPDANVTSNLNTLFADVKLWGSTNGYVDYLCPQIYYSYRSETTNFSKALNTWSGIVTASKVKLMVGLAVYKIGYKEDYWACTNDKRESHKKTPSICGVYGWQASDAGKSDILARQCTDSLSLKKCGGVFLYSYNYVFNINSGIYNSTTYVSNAVNQAKTEMANLKEILK